MDLCPSVVRVDDVSTGRLHVLAHRWYPYGIRVTRAGRFRFLHRSGVGTHYLEHDVPALFLLIALVQQLVLARIELEQKMLITVSVGIGFLDYSSNADAGSTLLQSFGAVHVIP